MAAAAKSAVRGLTFNTITVNPTPRAAMIRKRIYNLCALSATLDKTAKGMDW